MLNKGVKVSVAVKQREATLNAASGNHRINGFAHGDSQRPQRTEVLGRLNGDVLSNQINDNQGSQQFSGQIEIVVAVKALKHFGQHKISDYHGLEGSAQQPNR